MRSQRSSNIPVQHHHGQPSWILGAIFKRNNRLQQHLRQHQPNRRQHTKHPFNRLKRYRSPKQLVGLQWDFKNDNIHLGTVTFEPFLTEPEPSAPAVPSSIVVPTEPPGPSPTTTPSISPTPIISTPTPYKSSPTPFQSYLPATSTPGVGPIVGFKPSDLESVAVIAVAVAAAAAIIVTIHLRFTRSTASQPTKRRKHKPKNAKNEAAAPSAAAWKLMFFIRGS